MLYHLVHPATIQSARRMERKTAYLSLRIGAALKRAAERAAAKDHRPLSSLVALLLANHCKEHELLTDDGRLLKGDRNARHIGE
jgi:hypothetical protein